VGVVVGVVLATSVFGQGPTARRAPRGRVTRMDIFDGSRQTVRYFGDNVSPGESSTLRDVERLENELSYLNNLQTLKDQYVVSERLLEAYRRQVQLQLYGRDVTRSSYGTNYAVFGNGGFGYPSFGLYGGGFNNAVVATGGTSDTERLSLADGVGPEGTIKQAMAGVLAQQASPEYVAKIDRSYDMALMRATASPTLRAALRMPSTEDTQRERDRIVLASGEAAPAGSVVVTLQDGEKIQGKKLTEKGDFYLIETAGGSEEVRKTAVMRIQRGRTGGVVPATDR
jgi:hypothetical protein